MNVFNIHAHLASTFIFSFDFYLLRHGSQSVSPDAQRSVTAFAAQRISVAVHIAAAQEIAEALGLSVAADPRE